MCSDVLLQNFVPTGCRVQGKVLDLDVAFATEALAKRHACTGGYPSLNSTVIQGPDPEIPIPLN